MTTPLAGIESGLGHELPKQNISQPNTEQSGRFTGTVEPFNPTPLAREGNREWNADVAHVMAKQEDAFWMEKAEEAKTDDLIRRALAWRSLPGQEKQQAIVKGELLPFSGFNAALVARQLQSAATGRAEQAGRTYAKDNDIPLMPPTEAAARAEAREPWTAEAQDALHGIARGKDLFTFKGIGTVATGTAKFMHRRWKAVKAEQAAYYKVLQQERLRVAKQYDQLYPPIPKDPAVIRRERLEKVGKALAVAGVAAVVLFGPAPDQPDKDVSPHDVAELSVGGTESGPAVSLGDKLNASIGQAGKRSEAQVHTPKMPHDTTASGSASEISWITDTLRTQGQQDAFLKGLQAVAHDQQQPNTEDADDELF